MQSPGWRTAFRLLFNMVAWGMEDTTRKTPVHETFQSVETIIIDGLGKLASYFGFSKAMGQLFGVLMLSPAPLSLDDLMDRLGISKASVSTHMRSLEHMGIVREVWIKDDRRKFYRTEHDFWRMISNILQSRELRDVNEALRVLDDNAGQLQQALPEMNDNDRALAEFYIERLGQLQEFFRFAQMLLMSLIEHAQEQPEAGHISRIDIE